MAYVTVPKDLTKIKSKVMFNLTKRQLLCFGAAVAIGLPLFFLTKDSAGTTTAALCMVLAMLPMFLLAMYEKNGQPLEVIIFISRGFYSCPESLKVVQWYGSFCHFHSPCYILQFTFLFGYVHTIHIIRLNTSCCVLTVD